MGGQKAGTLALDDITGRLDDLTTALTDEFGESNPARVQQALAAAATLRMATEALFTETPYTLS